MPYTNLNITVSTGLDYKVNDFITLQYDANTIIYGRVVSYNSGTGAMVLTPLSLLEQMVLTPHGTFNYRVSTALLQLAGQRVLRVPLALVVLVERQT